MALFTNISPIPCKTSERPYGAKPMKEARKVEKIAVTCASYVTAKGATKYVYAMQCYPTPKQDVFRAFGGLYTSGSAYLHDIDGVLTLCVTRSADEIKDGAIRNAFETFIETQADARKWSIIPYDEMKALHAKARADAAKAQKEFDAAADETYRKNLTKSAEM